MGGGGKSGTSAEAAAARADEQARQQRVRDGTERINSIFDGQFTDGFFGGRRDAFLNYAKPQVESQYGDANKQLTFALERSGLLDSTVRGEKFGELAKLYDTNMQGVADEALREESSARTAIEDARGGLISTLNATGDAEGASKAALARATALSRPEPYSPLTQLFADFTGTLGTQAALERANYYSGGATGARYNTGLFAPSSSVVVR